MISINKKCFMSITLFYQEDPNSWALPNKVKVHRTKLQGKWDKFIIIINLTHLSHSKTEHTSFRTSSLPQKLQQGYKKVQQPEQQTVFNLQITHYTQQPFLLKGTNVLFPSSTRDGSKEPYLEIFYNAPYKF